MKEPLLPLAENRAGAAHRHSPCSHHAVKILALMGLLLTAFLAVALLCFPSGLLSSSTDLAKVTSSYQVCLSVVITSQGLLHIQLCSHCEIRPANARPQTLLVAGACQGLLALFMFLVVIALRE